MAPAAALAHGLHESTPPTLAAAWTADPWLLAPWLAMAALYALGAARLALRPATRAAFWAGWLALGSALVWPLDAYAEWSLAAHMTQHMILLALAPPLLVAGAAPAVWLAALPARAARGLARPWRRLRFGGVAAAAALQAALLWAWHAPAALDAALASDALHRVMHASLALAALWFWHALRGAGFGRGLAALIATMAQMGLLGALLTFAPRPWYPHYAEHAPALGLAALADQQLAGLVMWVPGALPYLVGGLAVVAAWLRGARRSVGERTYKRRAAFLR